MRWSPRIAGFYFQSYTCLPIDSMFFRNRETPVRLPRILLIPPSALSAERKKNPRAADGTLAPPLSRSISHAYSYLISHFLTGVFSQRAVERRYYKVFARRRNYLPIFDVLNFVGERKIYPGINLKIEFFNFKWNKVTTKRKSRITRGKDWKNGAFVRENERKPRYYVSPNCNEIFPSFPTKDVTRPRRVVENSVTKLGGSCSFHEERRARDRPFHLSDASVGCEKRGGSWKKKNRLSLPPSLWNNGMSKSRCVPDFPRTSILFREILGLNFNITVDRRSFLSAPGFSIIFSALALLKYFETAAALKRNLISSKVGIKSSLIVVNSYDISILSPFYRIFLKKNYSILLEDKSILAIIRTKFLIWSKSLKQVSRWKNSGKVSSFFEESRVHRGRSRWRRMFRR